MLDTREIGSRVESRMAALGLSPATLAKLLGVTEDSIYRLIRGETVKQWVRLAQVASLLRTTPNVLLGVDGGGNRERQSALVEAAFEGLGLPTALARNLGEIYLEALDTPPDPQSPVDGPSRLRIAAETLKRQSAAR